MNNLNLPKKVGTKIVSCFIYSTFLLPPIDYPDIFYALLFSKCPGV